MRASARRWASCTLRKTFTPEAKARALAMVNDLKSVLRERLATLEWMGAETRTAALGKLDAFGVKIGYPDKWRDYSALDIKRQPYVLNILAAGRVRDEPQARQNRPADRQDRMGHDAADGQRVLQPDRATRSCFPAGILQPPFFSADADDAVNYGGIGAVIGHEMTHGFDDQGRQYDAQGNLKNWWTAGGRQELQGAQREGRHAVRRRISPSKGCTSTAS